MGQGDGELSSSVCLNLQCGIIVSALCFILVYMTLHKCDLMGILFTQELKHTHSSQVLMVNIQKVATDGATKQVSTNFKE